MTLINPSGWIDVVSGRLDARAIYATDDFFAEKENLIKSEPPVYIAGKYTSRGKWMDGWESRRKRVSGFDYCIIQLAEPANVYELNIDTSHFTGNHPPQASVEGLSTDMDLSFSDLKNSHLSWMPVLGKSPLQPDSSNIFQVKTSIPVQYLKLSIYPDGGVARFRAYGEFKKNWELVTEDDRLNLAQAIYGARIQESSDAFFGDSFQLILPGRALNMGEGWETRRSRKPENVDWTIICLAHPGIIEKLIIDTRFFKGNYPDSCTVESCYIPKGKKSGSKSWNWMPLISNKKLNPDAMHNFIVPKRLRQNSSHIKLKIFPDGGISRLRAIGHIIK